MADVDVMFFVIPQLQGLAARRRRATTSTPLRHLAYPHTGMIFCTTWLRGKFFCTTFMPVTASSTRQSTLNTKHGIVVLYPSVFHVASNAHLTLLNLRRSLVTATPFAQCCCVAQRDGRS